MTTIIYNNIDTNFTFENICSQLTKFWINEVVKSNYSKIWLTIIINKKNNRRSILIKNLPFSTYDYTDVVIVLKQILDSNKSINKDILKTITFKFNFDKHVYNWNVIRRVIIKIILLLTTLFIITCIYIIFFEVNHLLNINIINENIFSSNNVKAQEILQEIIPPKGGIFDSFINLFKRSSQCSYIPSYFIPTKSAVKTYDFNLLEYIIKNQYIILDQYTMNSLKEITELTNLLEQSNTFGNNLLEQYQTIDIKLLKQF